MRHIVVHQLRVAGPPDAASSLLDELEAMAEQHVDCRVTRSAEPLELYVHEDDEAAGVDPALLAVAARRASEALAEDTTPPPCGAADIALAVGEHLGTVCRAVRVGDRELLLAAATALVVTTIRARPLLTDDEATPLARTLEVAAEDEQAGVLGDDPRLWGGALLDAGAFATDTLLPSAVVLVDEPPSPDAAADALVDLGAVALEVLAIFGQG